MTTLPFAETHNLVAFLEKPTESEGFEQIIDFLNASSIRYALTVNPTIYTMCIQQSWATVKVKTVNGEVQLQALVVGKKIVVSEASVRRDLQLEDANGVDCLPNATIFEQLTIMGAKTTAWNEFSSTMASAFIWLSTNQKFNFSKYIFESMVKNSDNEGKFMMYPRKPKRKDTEAPLPSGPITNVADEAFTEENVSKHSNDPLLSGEDSMQLKELMELCTNIQQRVIDLETTKTTQGSEITSLKRRVKKLEKKNKLRTHKLKILYKAGLSRRVKSSDEASLGVLNDEEVFARQDMAEKEVSTADPVTTAGEVVTTANVEVSTTSQTVATITNVELTLAQTLAKLKSARPKTKGVVMQDPSESTTTTTIPSKDKGKAQREQEKLWNKKALRSKRWMMINKLKSLSNVWKSFQMMEAIEATSLSTKSPTIVDYKIHKEGKKSYFQIIRADGNSQMYLTFGKMLKNFDKEDLEVLWSIVKASVTPPNWVAAEYGSGACYFSDQQHKR
ncbi:hypothetical protein Tco_0863521, partial [Tanacetum coccineum]